MTARLLLPVLFAAAAAATVAPPASASGADALAPRASASGSSSSSSVAPRASSPGMSVTARDAKGNEHQLQMESRDGHVIIKGQPDPHRPWMGVLLSDPDEVERLHSDLPTQEHRWTITAVAKDSPAERAGLERGDVITSVGGREASIEGPGILENRKPGDTVRLEIERDGRTRDVEVELGSHPGTVEFPDADGLGTLDLAGNMWGSGQGLEALKSLKALKRLPCPQGTNPQDCPGALFSMGFPGGPRLGVSVEQMSEQLAKFFGAPDDQGLLVKDVIDDTPAQRGGIQAGDVILTVAGEEIHVPADIREALESHEAGETVPVELLRRGQRMTVRVTLEEKKESGSLWSVPGYAPVDAETIRKAVEEAKQAYGPEQQKQVEQALEQARRALEGVRGQEGDVRRAVEEAQRAHAEAQREAVGADRERAETERHRAQIERELHRAHGAGGSSEQARRELERALQGQPMQAVPTDDGLIDF